MFIFHITTSEGLMGILKDGEIKSSALTGTLNEGSGIYKKSNWVYFSTTDKLFDRNANSSIILFLDSKALKNRNFYVYQGFVGDPKKTKLIKKNNPDIDKILYELYKNSIKPGYEPYFRVFQQIAVQKRLKLGKFLRGVMITRPGKYSKIYEKITRIIFDNYPRTELFYPNMEDTIPRVKK